MFEPPADEGCGCTLALLLVAMALLAVLTALFVEAMI